MDPFTPPSLLSMSQPSAFTQPAAQPPFNQPPFNQPPFNQPPPAFNQPTFNQPPPAFNQPTFNQPPVAQACYTSTSSCDQPSNTAYNAFDNVTRAVIPPNHPYNAGTINGVPIPRAPPNSIYIEFNAQPVGRADPGKLYWKILGEGTYAYKDRIKQLGASWMSSNKHWGIATSTDPNDHRFIALVSLANDANQNAAARGQSLDKGQNASNQKQSFYSGAAAVYQPPWATAPQTQPPFIANTVPVTQATTTSPRQLQHGQVTPASTNEIFVTFRIRTPSIGDRIKVTDISSPGRSIFVVFSINSVYDSPNGQYKDTFTARVTEPQERVSNEDHIFKIVNGEWTFITTASTIKNTFKVEFL